MCEKDIDHEYTDEIVCPFCGHEFSDSWEFSSNEEDLGLNECEQCGKSFYATRNVSVTYSTNEADYGTCGCCKTDDVVIEDYHSTVGRYSGLCIKCGEIEKRKLEKEYIHNLQREINIKASIKIKKCASIINGKCGMHCDGNWINPDGTCTKDKCQYQKLD